MCGITGIIDFNHQEINADVLQGMCDIIKHRGPDDGNTWINKNVGFGHRRLSIIDLSSSAKQPMQSNDGRFVIVYNGEIYNYHELQIVLKDKGVILHTKSDTEVIIELYRIYGVNCLNMLRGMFAFVIWDNETSKMILTRDRIGIKPLYYAYSQESFIFASEIKALAFYLKKLTFNRNAFWYFIRTCTFGDNDTVFAEIKKLEPGNYIIISNNTISFREYWNLTDSFHSQINDTKNEDILINEFHEKFNKTIEYHLVADVPVGGFLSGGLDSSAILAYMKDLAPTTKFNTFSIVFPEHDERFNEEKYSDVVSKHLNTNHHKIIFNQQFIEDIDTLVWHCDEPFGIYASFALFYLAKETAKESKVVLTGDGADELLAGYQGFLKDFNPYRSFRYILETGQSAILAYLKINNFGNKKLTDLWLKLSRKTGTKGLNIAENTAYSSALDFNSFNNDYIEEAWKSWEINKMVYYYDALTGNSDLRRRLYSSLKTRLVDEMLTKVDRMTMAHGLEARVPFLDHKLVEYCNSLPDEMKLKKSFNGDYTSKYILRKNSERFLPKEVIYREKHGFDIPFKKWLNTDLFYIIKDTILSGVLIKENILDKNKLDIIFHEQQINPKTDHSQFIFNLFIFETWYNTYSKRINGFQLKFN
jgi:asparagine synthase (glutamine-hydrolysing)